MLEMGFRKCDAQAVCTKITCRYVRWQIPDSHPDLVKKFLRCGPAPIYPRGIKVGKPSVKTPEREPGMVAHPAISHSKCRTHRIPWSSLLAGPQSETLSPKHKSNPHPKLQINKNTEKTTLYSNKCAMYKRLSLTELMKYQIKIKSKYLEWYVYFVSMLRVALRYFEHEVFSAKFLVWFETESPEAKASLQTSLWTKVTSNSVPTSTNLRLNYQFTPLSWLQKQAFPN